MAKRIQKINNRQKWYENRGLQTSIIGMALVLLYIVNRDLAWLSLGMFFLGIAFREVFYS